MGGDWRERAACLDVDPEIFFADDDEQWLPSPMAKQVSAGCPVRRECLADTPKSDKWSIRGGLTARQRRSRRAAA